jgi:hypothetical protein
MDYRRAEGITVADTVFLHVPNEWVYFRNAGYSEIKRWQTYLDLRDVNIICLDRKQPGDHSLLGWTPYFGERLLKFQRNLVSSTSGQKKNWTMAVVMAIAALWRDPAADPTRDGLESNCSKFPLPIQQNEITSKKHAPRDKEREANFYTLYRGCSRRNVQYFGRVFLMWKYADITQNTCVQSWTVTEIINKCATPVKVSNFSGHYLRNRSTLDIGVSGYLGIVSHKEHPPEVWHIPPGTFCIHLFIFVLNK